jgi:hypothetical protein
MGLEFEWLNDKAMDVPVMKYLSGHLQLVSGLNGHSRKIAIPMNSVEF